MNAGSIEKSRRLSRIYGFLVERGTKGATSIEIQEACETVAPATCVSELRSNGHHIECTYLKRTDTGRKVYLYKLVG